MEAAERVVDWLYRETLQVDAEWSVPLPGGFRWWAAEQAQDVEVIGEPVESDGVRLGVVSVGTEVLRELELDPRTLLAVNGLALRTSALAGPVYDAAERKLRLRTRVWVHDGIEEWIRCALAVAAALQLCEARWLAARLAPVLGAEPAVGGPPELGTRPVADEILDIPAELVVPVGQRPAPWTAAEFHQAVRAHMQAPPAVLATSGDEGFVAEFPYGSSVTSICEAASNVPHPFLGSGLLLRQRFPIPCLSASDSAMLALSFNARELDGEPFGYGMGSYAFDGSTLCFITFIPSCLYVVGLLPTLFFAAAARAERVSALLTHQEWGPDSFSAARTGVMRALARAVRENA